jgi:putative alpha-1,2-mannosidase
VARYGILAVTIFLLLSVGFFGCGSDDDDNNDSGSDGDDDSADDDDTADDDDLGPDDDDDNDDDTFDPTQYVDPFIATAADHGQLSPAASVPFGMIKLGPDTLVRSHSGYDEGIPNTIGFSHVRIDGVGSKGAGGNIRVLPGLGDRTFFALWMGKKTEAAEPGYYTVDLGSERQIRAEMTATEKVGFHRYEFRSEKDPYLYVNFNTPQTDPIDSDWQANVAKDELYGWVAAKNVGNKGRYQLYFTMQFSRPFIALTEIDGLRVGKNARLDFDAVKDTPLLVKTGLSSVSVEEARNDMNIEAPDWDFDAVRERAHQVWKDHLGVVEVEFGEDPLKLATLFYTMLYRASHTPVNVTTHSGFYHGTDGQDHEAIGYRHHSCWSLWDTYRNKFALHNLLFPSRSGEIMQSLVTLYLEGKVADATDNEPYPSVRTEHAPPLLLDAYRKDVEFDFAPAMDAIKAEALPGGSPDREIEGSYDRWSIAHLANILGDTSTYDDYLEASAEYAPIWEDVFRDMGADADTVGARGCYQGTLWQYRWSVVHDIPGIIELDGGRSVFLDKAIEFFDRELYNHGNQPDLHAAFMFNFTGAPWRTTDRVRKILSEVTRNWYGGHDKWPIPAVRRIYLPHPWGMLMNMDDDAGTMSGWFVFGAIGLYPVTIGHPVYALTAPLFPSVKLNLESGETFVIQAEGVSKENRYVQSATLNGEALNRAWLYHDEVSNGGELIFVMGETPNESWGAAEVDAPPGAFDWVSPSR